MPEQITIGDRLDHLTEAQMKQLLSRVLLELSPDADPMLDPDEIEQQSAADRELLTDAANTLGLTAPTAQNPLAAARQLALAIRQLSPESEKIVDAALAEVEAAGPKLDFGLTAFVIVPLALAIAGAIARPHLEFESSETKAGSRKTQILL